MVCDFMLENTPVQTSTLQPNPYATPLTTESVRDPEWYLTSACRYFKGIGYVMLAYLMCVITVWGYELLTDDSMLLREKIGPPIIMLAMFVFFGAMIRNATRLPHDFDRRYKRSRWLGILAGAFGFPLLSIWRYE
jgi:hypothetical protein